MTRRLVVDTTCDVCGAEGAEAHQIALDGVGCEIDLCFEHQLELASALSPYLDAARG